jgi:hypothetical protein
MAGCRHHSIRHTFKADSVAAFALKTRKDSLTTSTGSLLKLTGLKEQPSPYHIKITIGSLMRLHRPSTSTVLTDINTRNWLRKMCSL